jgi:hypothetical protein
VTHEEPHAPEHLGREILEIVSAWPRLPAVLRAAVLAMLRDWKQGLAAKNGQGKPAAAELENKRAEGAKRPRP